MSQDEKLAKKRAPGSWTPSRYKGNRRALVDLEEKTLLVYDLDYVTHDQLDWIRQGFAPISRFEWFMHTSRSHTPQSPRVRMILPISRPMKPDEANAVFQFIAQELADDPEEGIEIPDLVSFRCNQTMFLPSISKDQEFWTDENVGEIVDVDVVLAGNPGWENYENLPYQEAERRKGVTDPNKRMEDPYQKPEPIGAWCRVYPVQDVIEEFLTRHLRARRQRDRGAIHLSARLRRERGGGLRERQVPALEPRHRPGGHRERLRPAPPPQVRAP